MGQALAGFLGGFFVPAGGNIFDAAGQKHIEKDDRADYESDGNKIVDEELEDGYAANASSTDGIGDGRIVDVVGGGE